MLYAKATSLNCETTMNEITSDIQKVDVEVKTDHAFIQRLDETLQRPEELPSFTYRLKTPLAENAFYITISDIILNEGTPHEKRQPFEIFINSKNMESFQWIVALTRLTSAIFRKGGDVAFIINELLAIYDPKGGYLGKGGIWVPSLVAEIGRIIERHFVKIGILKLDTELQDTIRSKMQASDTELLPNGQPLGERCTKCHSNTVIVMEGCKYCTTCGHSHCG